MLRNLRNISIGICALLTMCAGCGTANLPSCGECSFVSVLEPNAVYTNAAPHPMYVLDPDSIASLLEAAYD